MGLLAVTLSVCLVCVVVAVDVPPASLAALTQVGATSIAAEVKRGGAAVQNARQTLTQKDNECNRAADSWITNSCIPCVKDQCKRKAESCGQDLGFVGSTIKSVTDFGGRVTSTAKKVSNVIVDTGKKVVDGVKKVFGGWGKRSLRARRSEPSCDDIKRDAGTACQRFADKCPCTYDKNAQCSGYRAARQRYELTVRDYSWLSRIPAQASYQVKSVSYAPENFDANTGGFRNLAVSVSLFGKDMSFTIGGPLNPFDAQNAGIVFSNYALNKFKHM